jgi:hypothetical protein
MSGRPTSHRQGNWYLVTGLILGLLAGLLYSWVISPVKFIDTAPLSLRADFKDQYRLMIAASYQATGDLGRAQARLALLGDPDPVAALTDQAQQLFSAGSPNGPISALAALAQAIQQNSSRTQTPPPAGTAQSTPGGNALPTSSISGPAGTLLARPTLTPTATPGAPFAITVQENTCDPRLALGLLQVEVRNAAGQPVPGAEIVLAWSGGEEHFFTGLKPELGTGYADAILNTGVTYSVQLASNSATATGLSAISCPGGNGKNFPGGIHLIFQQP